MKNPNDKRKFPRVDFHRPVRCRGSASENFHAHLARDLSQGGLRLNSDVFLPVGTKIAIQVQLVDADRIFELDASVVWVCQQPYADGYHLGIEFTGGPSFEKWKISQFICQKE